MLAEKDYRGGAEEEAEGKGPAVEGGARRHRTVFSLSFVGVC
jgi:hypothetical protein